MILGLYIAHSKDFLRTINAITTLLYEQLDTENEHLLYQNSFAGA